MTFWSKRVFQSHFDIFVFNCCSSSWDMRKKLNSNTFDHVLIVSVLCKKLQANSIANGYKNSFAHVPLYATFVHVSIDCNFRYIKSLLNNFSLEKNPFYGNTIMFSLYRVHNDKIDTKWDLIPYRWESNKMNMQNLNYKNQFFKLNIIFQFLLFNAKRNILWKTELKSVVFFFSSCIRPVCMRFTDESIWMGFFCVWYKFGTNRWLFRICALRDKTKN